MCDCYDTTLPEQTDVVSAVDSLPPASAYGFETDPFADIIDLLHTDPQPDGPMPLFDPNAPSLATALNHLDAATLNVINPNPGYDAGVDPSTGSVAWYAPGDMTPSIPY